MTVQWRRKNLVGSTFWKRSAQLMKLKPDHAHAYNALGYTLADRTTRFSEAHELIKKALEISPEDPFIIDSLGLGAI